MRHRERTTFANMCMICDGQGNVIVQNRVDPHWPGITFPGGHVEPGESFTDAVIREVREETGLTISDLRLCGIKDWPTDDGGRYMVLLYRADRFTGALTSSEEGEVQWVKLSDLPQMHLASGMDRMLRLFLEEDLTEQYFYKANGSWVDVLK